MSSTTPDHNSDSAHELPRLRAGNRAREAAVTGLQRAFDEGQLDYSELMDRSATANSAKFQDELLALFQDLQLTGLPQSTDPGFMAALIDGSRSVEEQPVAVPLPKYPAPTDYPAGQVAHTSSAGNTAPMIYASEDSGTSWSMAIFSGSTQVGKWVCAPSHTAFTAFGGIDLDFTQAQLTRRRTVVDVMCLFGGVDIIVPEDFRVELKVLPLFGGAEMTTSKYVTSSTHDLPPDAPLIVVEGFCLFGGVEVKRVPRRR